ncbi:MAG: FAD-dependent oxidoreductase, partial [Pseudomonadota bacterium]
MVDLPTKARAVIIGGGVSGCSVAYHLAKLGWDEVVLLERRQLSCGTTWHAAGLIGQLRPSQNLTKLTRYSADLYGALEAETGVATGMRRNGSMTVALNAGRLEEIRRQASLARALDVDVQELSPAECKDMYPLLETKDVVGGAFIPGDGQCDPANIAMALAKGARNNGAKVIEGIRVTEVHHEDGRVTGVSWARGDGEEQETGRIDTNAVVNCAGMWARDLAASVGVSLPLHACEHFYIVTEGIDGLGRLPSLRVPDECAYYKEDAGKLLLGAFEPRAKPWGMTGIPHDFCFDELPQDFEHFEPILEQAVTRVPVLAEAGIHTFFNGPESFTPDDQCYIGEAPGLDGFWVAAGYNSIGINMSGGTGYALAQWMDTGHAPYTLWDIDIRRAQPFQKNRKYLHDRVTETLGLLFADHFPYRQPETARGVRRSPLHEHLKAQGAVFGETSGWERADWFGTPGGNVTDTYGWDRQPWFDRRAAEHAAIRNGVGLYDMSSFGKIRVEGA